MSYYRDLREYLEALDRCGMLRTVRRPINKDTELHPLVRWQFRGLDDESEWTGWLFENLTDTAGNRYDGRVATAIIGASRQVYAMALQCEPSEIHERWVEAQRRPIEPRLVDPGEAPCKQVIHIGESLLEHGGLYEFPIPIATNGWEALPRLTALSWHTRDPDTGVINVGTYNGTLMGPLRTSCRCPLNHLAMHWQKARRRGRPLEAAAVIGGPPVVSMVSTAMIPYGTSEHAIAGGLMGHPLELVRCETVDLEVPAFAEIVLEGEIATDWLEPDPASGEHTGYVILEGEVFAFNIRCITHRLNPIWHDYMSQMPPSESSMLRGIASEGGMLSFLRTNCGIPQVKHVAFHYCGGAHRIGVIQFQDVAGIRTSTAVVWRALLASLTQASAYPKIVIAVDEDVDASSLESVLWAVSTRFQPHRDLKIIQDRGVTYDQSAFPYPGYEHDANAVELLRASTGHAGGQGASALLIDATRKWAYSPVALPKREYMEHAREIWEDLGLPALKPRDPWHGISLGVWPEEFATQVELGERGEFEAVATDIISRGRRI